MNPLTHSEYGNVHWCWDFRKAAEP